MQNVSIKPNRASQTWQLQQQQLELETLRRKLPALVRSAEKWQRGTQIIKQTRFGYQPTRGRDPTQPGAKPRVARSHFSAGLAALIMGAVLVIDLSAPPLN